MSDVCCTSEFQTIVPATSLKEIWDVFEPTLSIDPNSEFYIPRTDPKLQSLTFKLKQTKSDLHAFLCGHRGSGKTTELNRLCHDTEIQAKYETVFLTAQDFGSEVIHLTHDAMLVEIGLALAKKGEAHGMPASLVQELNDWGREVVTTFLHDESLKAEVGAKGMSVWLTSRRSSQPGASGNRRRR